MPRDQAKTKRHAKRPAQLADPAANVVTVLWSLAVMTTLACDVLAAVAWAYFAVDPQATLLAALAGLLFFAAATIGLVALALLPVVLRFGKHRPPNLLMGLSIIGTLAPLLVIVARMLS